MLARARPARKGDQRNEQGLQELFSCQTRDRWDQAWSGGKDEQDVRERREAGGAPGMRDGKREGKFR